MVTFDPRKLVACDRALAVSLDGFENVLHFNFHGAGENEPAIDWEWLLVRGTHTTTKAVWLTVVTCVDVCEVEGTKSKYIYTYVHVHN